MKTSIFAATVAFILHASISESPAQTKKVPSSKKPGKASTRKAASPEPVYLVGPFDVAVERLPPHFRGNSFSKLYKEAGSASPKGEFETTAEFVARTSRKLEGKYAFVVNLTDSTYDADSETLTASLSRIAFRVGYVSSGDSAYIVERKITSERRYVGSNAFGATATITSTSSDVHGLLPKPGPISGGVDFSIKMPRAEAQGAKPRLRVLLIATLDQEQPEALEGGYNGVLSTDATITDPEEEMRHYYGLAVSIIDAWLFDESTGEIKAKYSASSEAGQMQLSVYSGKPSSDGYAVVSIKGNSALELNRGREGFGGGCHLKLKNPLGGESDLIGLKKGAWIGNVDISGLTRLVVTDNSGNVLFAEKVAPKYFEPWAESRRAAEAMWNAAPGGSVELRKGDEPLKNKGSLAGYRELWRWGVEHCGFPPLE